MSLKVTDVVDSFMTQNNAVAVLLLSQPATFSVDAENPRFDEIVAVLVWSWRTREKVVVEIDASYIVSASRGGQR